MDRDNTNFFFMPQSTGSSMTTPAIVPPKQQDTQPAESDQTGTIPPGDSPDGTTTPISPPDDGTTDTIPDSVLPIAAGATATLAAIGALGTAFAQGIPVREAISELTGLLRGRTSPEPLDILDTEYPEARPDQVTDIKPDSPEKVAEEIAATEVESAPIPAETVSQEQEISSELSPEEQQREELERRKAWEKFKEDTGKYDYESTDFSGDQMAKVRAEMAAEAAGSLTDLQRMQINDYIDLRAPDEETADKMRDLVDKMTMKTGDGKTLGNFHDIITEANKIIQETNQPELNYLERYSIREEIGENAKLLGEERGYFQDAAGIMDAMGDTKTGTAGKVSAFAGYLESYTGTGDSMGYALVKATTQMGIKELAFRNPIVSVSDTAFKYITTATMGKDASPSKALEFFTNTLFDAGAGDKAAVTFNAGTGQFEMGSGAAINLDSPEIRTRAATSLLSSIKEQLANPNLSTGDKQNLLTKQQELLDTLNELKGL